MAWNQDDAKKETLADKIKKLEESQVLPDMAIHCVIEAMEWSLRNYLIGEGLQKRVEDSTNIGEAVAMLNEEGKFKEAQSVFVLGVLDDIHEMVHQMMAGDGIKDINNVDLRELTMEWYNSDDFKKKYSSTPSDIIATKLGAE